MTHLLKGFFKEISTNKHLQERLYHTKEISDVAVIANELGFKITAAEVLKAQAGRLIELSASKPEEAKLATIGKKPNLGAQWGREGKGFLENAGYWLIQLHDYGYSIQSYNPDIENLLLQIDINNEFKSKINDCKTIAEIAKIAQESGFKVSAIALLVYQALNILSLDDQHVDLVAHGG